MRKSGAESKVPRSLSQYREPAWIISNMSPSWRTSGIKDAPRRITLLTRWTKSTPNTRDSSIEWTSTSSKKRLTWLSDNTPEWTPSTTIWIKYFYTWEVSDNMQIRLTFVNTGRTFEQCRRISVGTSTSMWDRRSSDPGSYHLKWESEENNFGWYEHSFLFPQYVEFLVVHQVEVVQVFLVSLLKLQLLLLQIEDESVLLIE